MKKVRVEVHMSSLSNLGEKESKMVHECVTKINSGFETLAKIDGFPSRHIQIGDTIFASLQEGGVVTVYPPVAKKPARPKKTRVSKALSKLRKFAARR